MTVLGAKAPAKVTINEMTTIASVWTHNQFIDGTAIKGQPLQLKIAAGNVPSFVDLATGGWGDDDPGPAQQRPDADDGELRDAGQCACRLRRSRGARRLRQALRRREGSRGGDAGRHAGRSAGDRALPVVPAAADLRAARCVLSGAAGQEPAPGAVCPYLQFAPSAWVLPLKFDGGGYRAGGKAMFDAEGNLWVGNNFTVGWQANDALWQGNASKFDPNGKPLSPITTGFTGGGMEGGTFGAAIDLKGNVWLSSYGSKSIAVFDKDGKPLTPPEGINFGGRLGLMQGIITAPNGDVWALGSLEAPAAPLSEGRLEQRPDRLRRRQRRALQVLHRAVPSRHRPAGPDLGVGQLVPRHPLSGGRPEPRR